MKTEEIKALVDKAEESVKAAELLASDDHFGFAAARAYYALFYAAEALLLTKQLAFSKHAGVIAAFGEKFVKTGLLPAKFHRYLISAYAFREIGDYEPLEKITREAAEQTIDWAKEFLRSAKTFLAEG